MLLCVLLASLFVYSRSVPLEAPAFDPPFGWEDVVSTDESSVVSSSSASGDWKYAYTSPRQQRTYSRVDIGKDAFNSLFYKSGYNIVRRECANCNSANKLVYYRRLAPGTSFDVYSALKLTWTSKNNKLGQQFILTSTLKDALAKTNVWKFCNYDDKGVGAFRDCGPNGYQQNQFVRVNGGKTARFSIYTAGKKDEGRCSALNIDYFLGQCSKYDFGKMEKQVSQNKAGVAANKRAIHVNSVKLDKHHSSVYNTERIAKANKLEIARVNAQLGKLIKDLKGGKAKSENEQGSAFFLVQFVKKSALESLLVILALVGVIVALSVALFRGKKCLGFGKKKVTTATSETEFTQLIN